MQLNIKDPEVYDLASGLARRTGKSMTEVVRTALRQAAQFPAAGEDLATLLADLDRMNLGVRERIIAREGRVPTNEEMDAEIYDNHGLPR